MRLSGMKKMFLLAAALAAALSVCYQKTEERGLLQTGKELEEEPPFCQGETKEAVVALTFEVSHGTEGVEEILEVLSGHGSRASFFLTGEWWNEHRETAQKIAAGGHEAGFLGAELRDMSLSGDEQLREEMEDGRKLLEELYGGTGREKEGRNGKKEEAENGRTLLFRAPYGAVSDPLLRAARKSGFSVIGWNVDSMVWKDYGTDAVVRMVMQKNELKYGSIVRFSADARDTPRALNRILTLLEEQGITPVTVSELL